jgi:hypothetical protein
MGTTNLDTLELSENLTVTGIPTFGYGVRVGNAKAVMSQTDTLTQNSTNAVSVSFTLPANSQITDIIVDVTTAFNSGTSATLSVGRTAGGTELASGVNAKTGGRVRPTFSEAQLGNMADITTHTTVIATVTPVGATSAGALRVTVHYVAP